MQVSNGIGTITKRLHRRSTSPRLDAELLTAFVLGTDRAGVLARAAEPLPAHAWRLIQRLADLRRRGVPMAYVTGHQANAGLNLQVDPRVLIPRPSTELLIAAVVDLLGRKPVTVADVGTGSGVIAISLASRVPQIHVEASDISPAALEVARQNAELHAVDDRIRWRFGSLLEPWMQTIEPEVVVANLPYLPTAAMSEPSIQHEPVLALHGGHDGLRHIERLIHQLNYLPLIESVALECLPSQVDTVAFWLRSVKPKPFRVRTVMDGPTTWGVIGERA